MCLVCSPVVTSNLPKLAFQCPKDSYNCHPFLAPSTQSVTFVTLQDERFPCGASGHSRYGRPWRRAENKHHWMHPKKRKTLAQEVAAPWFFQTAKTYVVSSLQLVGKALCEQNVLNQGVDKRPLFHHRSDNIADQIKHFQHGKSMNLVTQSRSSFFANDGRLILRNRETKL